MNTGVAAPGKLILLGEYGVLFGAPAAVMAVNRHARVELRPSRGDRWRFFSPGLATESAELEISTSGELQWSGGEKVAADFKLVDRLVRALTTNDAVDFANLRPAEVVLDTRQFHRSRDGKTLKLGLGSSAALTVALASALGGRPGVAGPMTPDPSWLQILVDVHRAVQGGSGSGIDVAASVLGGVVHYRLHDDGSIAHAAPVAFPDDLGFSCVWTGSSASTGDFLAQLELQRRRRPQPVEQALDLVCEVSERGLEALVQQESARFLDTVDEFWFALDALGKSIEMPILSKDHLRLRQIAEDCGVHYKPSGAGGGDFGVAFSTVRARHEEMRQRATAEAYEVMDLIIEPRGCREVPL